jgi:hypothetical protein
MTNTDLFIMSKGSKPGDTPTIGTNIYYDTPTNPLIICDDTFNSTNTIVCMEIRNDNSLTTAGAVVATSVLVDNSGGYSSGTTINTDVTDPRNIFSVGDKIYKSNGLIIGTIQSMVRRSGTSEATITLTSTIANSVADDDAIYKSNGVSNSQTYNILNRIYPDSAATSRLYLENLENTPGYTIKCAIMPDSSTTLEGQSLSGIDITTDDYFVMINPDDPLKHHFAKITAVTKNDETGDSFEFTPKYGSEVAKGIKFTIWKGPLVTDTAVVAVSYGLYADTTRSIDSDETDGTGTSNDSRHGGLTHLSIPLFYFYNDRLKKKNQLDHNTKYALHYSRSNDGTEIHYMRCFLTCTDYGLKAIDYSPYTMTATLIDKTRELDVISTSELSTYQIDNSVSNSYKVDVANWNTCFVNNKRQNENLIWQAYFGVDGGPDGTPDNTNYTREGSYIGPTRYLHYDTSPDKVNVVPEILELEVFDSINEIGSYTDIRIGDPNRIYGSKIKKFDKIKIKKQIATGDLNNDYTGLLIGKWTGSQGSGTITVTLDNEEQDLRILLKKRGASTFDTIKIGSYIYQIDTITAPDTLLQIQTVEVGLARTITGQFRDGLLTLQETITDKQAHRKPWSYLNENLIVDFTIDTSLTSTNWDSTSATDTIHYSSTSETISNSSSSGTRLYNAELVLVGGSETGLSFKIDYGDNNHNIIKLQSPRLQMYRDESDGDPNILDYYNGKYVIYKTIFVGTVETFEDYVEHGMLKYHIAGRNKISELFGPIINKDYKHTEDIVYSTYGPFIQVEDTSADINDSTGSPFGENTYLNVDGSYSNIKTYDLLFNPRGALLTYVDTAGGTIIPSILNREYVGAKNNDSIWRQKDDTNLISFTKALEANPQLTISPTSFRGTSGKGLIFTSGQKLTTDSYQIPTTELSTLLGTSSSTNSKALGYYINLPKGISTDLDLPFMAHLKDEILNSTKEIHTVNSLTEYEIIDIDTGQGSSIIELAPTCPIIMGRIDKNPKDIRFETLTATTINPDNTYTKGHLYAIEIDDTYANTVSIKDKYIYNSDSILLGKVLDVLDDGDSSFGCIIILDRPLPVNIATTDFFYTSTNKTHGLYLINTQGLRTGGIIQLVDSMLDTTYKPTFFNAQQTALGTAGYDSSNTYYCAINRYSPYSWRYLDLQKGRRGAISYVKRENITGDLNVRYSKHLGEFCAYAPAFRFAPAILTAPILSDFGVDNDFTNSYQKLGSHETRNIFPVMGSNFADYDKNSSSMLSQQYDYTRIPKKDNAILGGPWNIQKLGLTWDSTATRAFASGVKANAVKLTRDAFEIIDPKTITPFLFSTADLFPDSMTRTNHIGNVERDFANYSIMLKSKPSEIKSSIAHDKYDGTLNQLQLSDDSYQTLQINSASIKSNQMRKFGLMRLTEVTFDWHFNMVDPENLPDIEENNVPYFKYARYQKVVDSGREISSVSGADIICDSSSSLAAKFPNDTYVFDSNGNFLGEVDSISSATITCKAAVKEVNGAAASGDLYYVEKGSSSNNSYHEYFIGGRDGEDSFTNFSAESANSTNDADDAWGNNPRPLNMLQMAIFNGYGSTAESLVPSTTVAEEDNNEGYGFSSDTAGGAFKKSFIRKMDMAALGDHSKGYLNHLILPPVFEGYVLQKLYQDKDDTDAGDIRLWVMTTATSGTSIVTNADAVGDLNGQLVAGDKLYTDNGEFVGTFASASSLTITITENLNTTTSLTGDSSSSSHTTGTYLCKGGTVIDSKEIAVGHADNLGGGHALSSKKHIATYATAATAATIPTNEYVHPSRVLEGIFDYLENTTSKKNPYSNMRAVALRRHGIEGQRGLEGYSDARQVAQLYPGMSALMGGVSGSGIQQSLKLKIGSDKNETKKDYAPMLIAGRLFDSYTFPNGFSSHQDYRGEFAKWTRTKDDDGIVLKNRGSTDGKNTVCDGGEFVFKPLFNTQGTDTVISYSTHTINGSSIAKIRIKPSSDDKMSWIRYSPNLTGCYLASTDSKHFVNTIDDVTDNLYTKPINNRIPKVISYIISHEITRTESTLYHDFLIDNCASGTLQSNYRIMRPNHVCIYPNTPNEIDLYKMDSNYTKRADSDLMYEQIPLLRYFEEGWKTVSKGEPDEGEGIQSMYVIVNPDHTSTETYLVPRGINYDHDDKLFGDDKTFEKGTYDMLVNDGINKERKSMDVLQFLGGKYTKLRFDGQFKNKLSGVVSLGEVFTIETATSVKLQNAQTASIGTGITVGLEAEEIINDILEENDITYTSSTILYPYFTTANFQGADIYNLSKLLSAYKNKEILIDKDEIKLIDKNDDLRHTDIEISEDNSNIQVIEISKNESGFDIYNDIIVYGNGVKSHKRNMESIKEIGKKTLEEFDDTLNNQADVNEKAISLINFYNDTAEKITVKLANNNLEWIKTGDIITIDYPSEHIPRKKYVIFEIRHSTSSIIEIEVGGYSKNLNTRLAELIVQNKKVASFLRSDRFKSPTIFNTYFDKFRLKPIKLNIKQVSVAGHTPLGLSTPFRFDSLLDIGVRTTTELLNEDLT